MSSIIEQQQYHLPQPSIIPQIVPGRAFDPISSIKRNWKITLIFVVTVPVLGLLAAQRFAQPTYQAEASLRVLPTYDVPVMLGMDPTSVPGIDYRNFVQQQVFEIANPETILDALKLMGANGSLWQLPGESPQHAAERLMEQLKVDWIPDTFLISVSLQGSKAYGLAQIVNAVTSAYLSRQEKQELSGADRRVRLLQQRRDDLQKTLAEERAQLTQMTEELGVSSFSGTANNPYDVKLVDANVALERKQRELIENQARLAALQAQSNSPTDADLNSMAEKLIESDKDLADQESALRKEREDVFLQLQGLAPNHPGRPALEQKIDDIDEETNAIDDKALNKARALLLGSRSAAAHDKITAAQTQVDQTQRAVAGIQQELGSIKASASSFGAKYNQALAVHDEYENHLKELGAIYDRIDMMRVQSRSPGMASLELPALEPDAPESGKRKKFILILSAMATLVAGIGVPSLIDLTDPRIQSSHELEAVFHMPVLGNIGSNYPSDRDALRRIALGIIRERHQAGTRIFVITAVGEQAGTTSLTLALSRELTELDSPTVAVEANASFPDIRFCEQNSGFADFTNGSSPEIASSNGKKPDAHPLRSVTKTTFCDARAHPIIKASAALPDRMPICSHQRKQRLTMACIRNALDVALANYDLVLYDAPPVLKSADTAMLVQNPAGVVLVVTAARDHLADITATMQELSRLSPPVVGIVVQSAHHGPTEVSSTELVHTDLHATQMETHTTSRAFSSRVAPLRNV